MFDPTGAHVKNHDQDGKITIEMVKFTLHQINTIPLLIITTRANLNIIAAADNQLELMY